MKENLLTELDALRPGFEGLTKLSDDVVYLLGCRSFKQFCSTLRALLDPAKFCPFCQYTPERDLSGGVWSDWWLRDNDFPREKMLLVLPRKHLTDASQMTLTDWGQIAHLVLYALEHLDLPGGALVLRFGNPRHHAGTIPHLHFNIICPTGEGDFRVALSKDWASRQENYIRLREHRDELRQKGGIAWLLSDEGIAYKG